MKVNELRIGNWVNILGTECRIIEIDSIIESDQSVMVDRLIDGLNCSSDISNVKGIPLTEEWLVRFGFEKEYFGGDIKLPWYSIKSIDYTFNLDYEFCYSREDGGWIRLKHVHQLQNLYFALTGEELTIK